MQYARCKCGSSERWDSGYPIYPCQGCTKCNTTLARGPNGHKELQPHDVEVHTESHMVDGKEVATNTWKQCKVCGDRIYDEKETRLIEWT